MYQRVCKLSEEAERLGDQELQQLLANIIRITRYADSSVQNVPLAPRRASHARARTSQLTPVSNPQCEFNRGDDNEVHVRQLQ
jgi:hypothetical protein